MGLKSEKIEQMSKIQEKVVFDLQQLTVQNRLFDQILLYLVMRWVCGSVGNPGTRPGVFALGRVGFFNLKTRVQTLW